MLLLQLSPEYWQQDFDAAGCELRALQADIDTTQLECLTEQRAVCLEVQCGH